MTSRIQSRVKWTDLNLVPHLHRWNHTDPHLAHLTPPSLSTARRIPHTEKVAPYPISVPQTAHRKPKTIPKHSTDTAQRARSTIPYISVRHSRELTFSFSLPPPSPSSAPPTCYVSTLGYPHSFIPLSQYRTPPSTRVGRYSTAIRYASTRHPPGRSCYASTGHVLATA